MAFRRSFRAPSRSFRRSSFRSRGRTHVVTKPRRWSIAQINSVQTFQQTATSLGFSLRMVHIASIAQSLSQFSSTSSEQRVGGVLSALERKLEIGGIVFDWGIIPTGPIQPGATPEQASVDMATYLVTDRVVDDTITGQPHPASIVSWQPFFASFPMAALQSSTPTLESRESNQPTRIHWQRHDHLELGARSFVGSESVLYVPNEQKVRVYRGVVNRRLRLRLDDGQGLYFALGLQNPVDIGPMVALNYNMQWWFRGSLYYRYSQ